MDYIYEVGESLLSWRFPPDIVITRQSKGANRRHCHVRVGVGCLGATGLVNTVFRLVRLELSVHVPAEFLRSRLRVVELLLGRALQRLKLVLQHLEIFLSITGRTDSLLDVRVHLGRFLRDGDHCGKRQLIINILSVTTISLKI